jgi:hypothetical protein
MSDLREQIAKLIYAAMRAQAENGNAFDAPMVTAAVGSNEFEGTALIDGEIDLTAAADFLIRELGLRIQVAGADGIVGTGKYRYVTDFWEANE